MKVLNLRCSHAHIFEAWFSSEEDYLTQNENHMITCPFCGDLSISKGLSAPRLNLKTAKRHAQQLAAEQMDQTSSVVESHAVDSVRVSEDSKTLQELQALQKLQKRWLQLSKQVMDNTQDVGDAFAEQARRMHYGEIAQRGIRGAASAEEVDALIDEGIEVFSMPLPAVYKNNVQ